MPSRADDETVMGTIAGVGVSPTRRDDEIPERVAGRYQIVRWLGGGGMGRVYEAVDDELHAGLSDDALERFRREVRLTRRIQHRNVARTLTLLREAAAARG